MSKSYSTGSPSPADVVDTEALPGGEDLDALMAEIRENFNLCVRAEEHIREAARLDLQAVSEEGPWDPAEREARKKLNRPCIHIDQLTQYVNPTVNAVRMNKREVKITPAGYGATAKAAELRANRIRAIQYESRAQNAYITAFQEACTRSYGAFRVNIKWVSEDGFLKTLAVEPIPNPDCVFFDPYCKQPDRSDARFAFFIDYLDAKTFERRYPNATQAAMLDTETRSRISSHWLTDDRWQIAEYWKVKEQEAKVYLLMGGLEPYQGFQKDLEGQGFDFSRISDDMVLSPTGEILYLDKVRDGVRREVCQYRTNGVELLGKPYAWPGQWIPIVGVYGPERYISDGTYTERRVYSLVRMARGAQQLYDAATSLEVETLNSGAKNTYLGYEGQFETASDWENMNRIPYAYAEVKPTVDGAMGQVLPLPTLQQRDPPIAAYEMAKQSAAIAIQNALGMQAVERREKEAKSGKALEALDRQSDLGSFHFIDNFDRALAHAGRIMNDLLDKIETEPREVAAMKPDETTETLRINEMSQDPKTGEPVLHTYGIGRYDVTVSTGPSYESQRQEANQFLDVIAGTPLFPMVADLAIKAKNLGPIGDQIADRLKPPEAKGPNGEEIPEQARAVLAQQEQQMQALNAYAKQLEGKLQEALQKLESKEGEGRVRLEIAKIQADVEKFKVQIQAEANAKRMQLDAMSAHEKLSSAEQISAEDNDTIERVASMKIAADFEKSQRAAEPQPGVRE